MLEIRAEFLKRSAGEGDIFGDCLDGIRCGRDSLGESVEGNAKLDAGAGDTYDRGDQP